MKMFLVLAVMFASLAAFADNFTTREDLKSRKVLESDGIRFVAIKSSDDILLSYPRSLIGQGSMFGTVVTKVSDKTDAALGNLKLSSFNSLAQTHLINTNIKKALVLTGGFGGTGSEGEPTKVLAEIPVTEITDSSITLNLSALGKELNIAPLIAEYDYADTKEFIHLGSKTVAVDFSLHTLVFDVESAYKIESTNAQTKEKTSKEVTLTSRWFMKLNSFVDPYFVPRKNTEGVGYFTNGEKNDYISRFSITDLATNPVKYYVKNVPLEHRAAILSSFEDWNHKLQNTLGHNLLTYEIIEKDDPRYNQIVAGDIRYNVFEWDVDNVASYGGLGPSLKNGLTGETMAGQTLIQGPEILSIYKKWFKVNEGVRLLRSQGQNVLAEKMRMKFLKEVADKTQIQKNVMKFDVAFGKIKLHVPAQDPNLHDPLAVDPLDFFEIPAGYTYEAYMNGYWREIAAHELGHNLGLRHNFRGSLKDNGEGTVSSVSRSVMEYLGRGHRHLNRVSEYDIMAIAYGYLGREPEHKDWFCTDGDQGVYSYKNSAECSSLDATSDPLNYLEGKINRALDLILARNSTAAPEWRIEHLSSQIVNFLNHTSAYAYTAPMTADKWTNFFGKEGRPETAEEVPKYILGRLNEFICGKNLETEVANKGTTEAQKIAMENLKAYRAVAFEALKKIPSPWTLVTKENFSCLE